jgi:hypothetical protein
LDINLFYSKRRLPVIGFWLFMKIACSRFVNLTLFVNMEHQELRYWIVIKNKLNRLFVFFF